MIFDGNGDIQPVQRQGRRLPLLRGADDPQHRDRDLGRHAAHRRRQGAHGEEEPVREHRHGRLHQPCALEQLLHRRQLVHRPQPHRLPDQLVGCLVRQLPRRRLPALRRQAVTGLDAARRPEVRLVHRGEDLRSGARDGLQLREGLPRRDRQRDLRQPGRLVRDRSEPARHHQRAEVSAAGVLGPAAGGARLLQQPDGQLPRQPVRDGRQPAQRAQHAQPDASTRPRTCGATSRRWAGRSTGSGTSAITCPVGPRAAS